MKREQLDRLMAKYEAGETSAHEEQALRNAGLLDATLMQAFDEMRGETMDWGFQSMLQKAGVDAVTNEPQAVVPKPVTRHTASIGWLWAAAAALLLMLGLWPILRQKPDEISPKTASTKPHTGIISTTPVANTVATPPLTAQATVSARASAAKAASQAKGTMPAPMVKQPAKYIKPATQPAVPAPELLVVVNGKRITNESEAVLLAQSALTAATTNLNAAFEEMPVIHQNDFKLK